MEHKGKDTEQCASANLNPNPNRNVEDSIKKDTGATALMLASQNGNLAMIEALLGSDYGSQISARTNKGASALYYAAQEGHVDATRRLIEAKAAVNDVPKKKSPETKSITERIATGQASDKPQGRNVSWTPLAVAVAGNHVQVAEVLCAAKADVNGSGDNKRPPLVVAAARGMFHMARALIDLKADINLDVIDGKNSTNPIVSAKKSAQMGIRDADKIVEYLLSRSDITFLGSSVGADICFGAGQEFLSGGSESAGTKSSGPMPPQHEAVERLLRPWKLGNVQSPWTGYEVGENLDDLPAVPGRKKKGQRVYK